MYALPDETHTVRLSKVAPSVKKVQRSSASTELCNLQLRQHVHDEKYHQDIWCLPYNARIKHMVLHFAKYAGKFVLAEERQDKHLLTSTLVDTWIIALASANILNIRLSHSLGLDDQDAVDLYELGDRLEKSEIPISNDPYRLAFRELTKTAGYMAKACESMDHGEAFDSRGTLERGVIHVAKLSLALAHSLHIDLFPRVQKRWKEVEAKSIF